MALEREDDPELMQLRAAKATLDKIGAKPEIRRKFLQLFKEGYPESVIPEIDAAAPIMAAVEDARKLAMETKAEIEKDREERKKDSDSRNFQSFITAGRSKLRDAGYTDDGITAIEKMMGERGYADYDVGLTMYEKANPPAEPVIPTPFGNRWNLPQPTDDKDTTTKNWFDNWEAQSQREVNNWMTELRAERATNRRR